MSNVRGALLLLPLIFLSLACQSLKSPTASVAGVNVSNISADGITMLVDLDVANPNDVDLPATDANYTLSLSGSKLLNGKADLLGGTVPANGHARVTMPVLIDFDNLFGTIDAIANTAAGAPVKYRLDAKLNFGAGWPKPHASLPIQHSGELSFKAFENDPLFILKSKAFRKGLEELFKGLN
ncbi:MAG: LEA type 2 family protein [Tepidisphaeraceae bacterium]